MSNFVQTCISRWQEIAQFMAHRQTLAFLSLGAKLCNSLFCVHYSINSNQFSPALSVLPRQSLCFIDRASPIQSSRLVVCSTSRFNTSYSESTTPFIAHHDN
jgi:hypothetical protein